MEKKKSFQASISTFPEAKTNPLWGKASGWGGEGRGRGNG